MTRTSGHRYGAQVGPQEPDHRPGSAFTGGSASEPVSRASSHRRARASSRPRRLRAPRPVPYPRRTRGGGREPVEESLPGPPEGLAAAEEALELVVGQLGQDERQPLPALGGDRRPAAACPESVRATGSRAGPRRRAAASRGRAAPSGRRCPSRSPGRRRGPRPGGASRGALEVEDSEDVEVDEADRPRRPSPHVLEEPGWRVRGSARRGPVGQRILGRVHSGQRPLKAS